ncbi:transposase [Ornithinimicrobium sufpigmenti]|uniref:transposase n=1 Tax=Ornithinimicrobium sufpigmenti TaxID=2508882 RepID=UPI003CE4E3B4
MLTSLPGVATIRAAAFAAHSLPIARFPDAEHLYSATGLAPAMYGSATLRRRGRISRQGLSEHRDALMGIAWGLSRHSPSFAQRDAEYRARGMAPIQARVALARHACRLAYRLLRPNNLSMRSAIVEEGSAPDGDGHVSYAAHPSGATAQPSLPPVRDWAAPSRRTRKPAARRRLISLPTRRPSRTNLPRQHPPSSGPEPDARACPAVTPRPDSPLTHHAKARSLTTPQPPLLWRPPHSGPISAPSDALGTATMHHDT